MFSLSCPQCKKDSDGAANRLVKDSCGHQKCRGCLFLDEENCKQCVTEQNQTVIKCENHTAVITCNGTPKKEDLIPAIKQNVDTTPVGKKTVVVPSKNSKNKNKPKTAKKGARNLIIPSHIITLKDPPGFKCDICNKQFATKSNVKYHIYCTGKTKPFQCTLCSKDFITKTHLDVHTLKHTGTKPFNCNVCQKSFSEKSKLKRHSILHTTQKPYVCSECGKGFRGKESLKIHTLIHRGQKPFSCWVCNMKFNNTSNLNKHLISHSNEKAHMCDQCGKRFKMKWALTEHKRSHLRTRPFVCATCSRAFINNKDLQRHQLTHLDAKAFSCSICKTSFRRKDNLYRHVKNTHPGKKAEAISSTVKQLLDKPIKPVDNPNAINVITASPVCKQKPSATNGAPDNRPGTVINGPLKLAFKTSTFKNNYNIHRDYDDIVPKVPTTYDLAESVNICQKILSPHSPPMRGGLRKDSEPNSTEICQKILSPYPSRPIHYETSFEHRKHAIIKNIKFKLPANYTNLIRVNEDYTNVMPLKPISNVSLNLESELSKNMNTYTDLKTVPHATTSVIVNSLNHGGSSNMHWRRRTSQNLCSKTLDS